MVLTNIKPVYEETVKFKDLMLLHRVVKKINSILNVDELLEQIVSDVSESLGFTRCAILLFREDDEVLELAALNGWEDTRFKKGDQLCREAYLVWNAIRDKRTKYYPDIKNHPDYEPCDYTSRTHLDIPLIVHDKIVGLFNIQHAEANKFGMLHINFLEALAGHISIALENAKLFETEQKEKSRYVHEMKLAQKVQNKLFPDVSPEIPGFKIDGLCKPSLHVGGDWFDYIERADGKIGIVLGDVIGKGMSAALLMSSARSILRVYAEMYESPAEVLKSVNKKLIEDFPFTKFITMIYAVLDPFSGKMTIANAGHPMPILKKGTKAELYKVKTGLPLGIVEEEYEETVCESIPRCSILFYSDGVTEARYGYTDEYGELRLIDNFIRNNSSLKAIFNEVYEFSGEEITRDDITLVKIDSDIAK